MCGIAGVYSQTEKSTEIGREMINKISHRGPDSQGYFDAQNIHLGNCRLSIIDLKTGDQPVFNEDKTVILVFNGEIYNFPEIRRGLLKKGHKFKSNSDTETIVHLYEEKGIDCLQDLNGMFAFALWDAKKQMLFLARDRLGVKPLIWSFKNSKFVFGSELKAVLAGLDFKPDFNRSALAYYFTLGFMPAPMTIYEDVFKLEPAHYLIFNGKKILKKRYWQAPRQTKNISIKEAKNQFYELTKQAVERRLISDVPLGAFLSGGFDSSAVVGLMKKLAGKVETFSIGFEGPSFFNELSQAKRVAEYFGVRNHSEVIDSKKVISLIPEVLNRLDEPFADSSIIPTYLLSKITAKELKVALSGDGGDEVLVGYSKYQGHYWNNNPMFRLAAKGANFLPVSRQNRLGELLRKASKFKKGLGLNLPERHFTWTAISDDVSILGLENLEVKNWYLSLFKDKTRLEEALLVDLELNLPDDMLTKVDLASMANSLEVRSPFLDYKLIEFIFGLPADIRFHSGQLKYLAKESFKDLLPDFVLNYRKQGFEIPIGEWLREDLESEFKKLISYGRHQLNELIDFDGVDNLFKEHLAKGADNSKTLWSIYVFLNWTKRYF
jgi:asparagine synthase (glutamine-hydrolysing)